MKCKGTQEDWAIWKKIRRPVFLFRFFKNEQFCRFLGAWRRVALSIGPAARRRGRLAGGKALPLTCHFSNTMQLMTIVKTGMCYLTLQVHTGTNLEDIEHVSIFWNQITQDRCTRRTKEVNVKTIRRQMSKVTKEMTSNSCRNKSIARSKHSSIMERIRKTQDNA